MSEKAPEELTINEWVDQWKNRLPTNQREYLEFLESAPNDSIFYEGQNDIWTKGQDGLWIPPEGTRMGPIDSSNLSRVRIRFADISVIKP